MLNVHKANLIKRIICFRINSLKFSEFLLLGKIMNVKIGKKVFIHNAGKDEYWLQDLIY